MTRRRRWHPLCALPIVALMIAAVAPLSAQSQPSGFPTSGYVLEHDTHDRWVNATESRAFTPFSDTRLAVRLGIVSESDSERTIALASIGVSGGATRQLTLSPTGRVIRQTAVPPKPPALTYARTRADSDRAGRLQSLGVGLERFDLPDASFWDLIPIFHPERPERGARWTDTLSFSAELYDCRESVDAIRSSVIVGDTSIDGQTLWVVRTTARVNYRDHYLVDQAFIDTALTVERTASGVASGSYLYDAARRFITRRADTTTLTGTATLGIPGGQTITTPTSYESVKTSRVVSPLGYPTQYAGGGIIDIQPPNPYKARLGTGPSALRDSLIGAWSASRDPVERRMLFYALLTSGLAGRRDVALLARLSDSAFAAGDRSDPLMWRGEYTDDTARVQHTLSVLRDPAAAYASGIDVGAIFWSIGWALRQNPPVLFGNAAASNDGPEPGCAPVICRLLAAQWNSATTPWLRDLGLLTLVAMNPKRWGDTLTARAAAGDRYLGHFGLPSIPAATADWTAWMRELSNCTGPGCRPWTFEQWSDETNQSGIQFAEAWTGRDVMAELRRKATLATNDSARLTYEDVIVSLGGAGPAPAAAVQRIQSAVPTTQWLGRQEARTLLMNGAAPVDTLTSGVLADRLLSMLVDGAPQWPTIGISAALEDSALHQISLRQAPLDVMTAPLPAASRARWATRATLLVGIGGRTGAPEPAGATAGPDSARHVEITISQPVRAGPFARVTVRAVDVGRSFVGSRTERVLTDATLMLLETASGWVVIDVRRR